MYKKSVSVFWTAEELDLAHDAKVRGRPRGVGVAPFKGRRRPLGARARARNAHPA